MSIQIDLQKLADAKRAALLARYFKTGKGEYGEGDTFIGLTVPQVRAVSNKYKDLPLTEIEKLLHSPIHEFRLAALCILIKRAGSKEIVDFYLKNTKYINNWDLVDLSAKYIVGGYLLDNKPERKILFKLASSKYMWERRIAVLSTFLFIDNNDFRVSLLLAKILLQDKHDLMHKAVGWMLREIGKKDETVLVNFLAKHYKTMPRTTLRYAIEKFDDSRRKKYLQGEV